MAQPAVADQTTRRLLEPSMPASTTDRARALILLIATVTGLWLGLAGPDTSPVAPPGSAPVSVLSQLIDLLAGPGGGGRQ